MEDKRYAIVMARGANGKLKLLYLQKILLERTDEEHGMTMPEIVRALEEYGISAERKSLYGDIETLLNPVTERYFDTGEEINMTSIYEEICRLEKSRIDTLQKDVARSYNSAVESFPDAAEEDRDYLQIFSFICSLSFDVYVKKLLIEKLIDELPEPVHEKKKK